MARIRRNFAELRGPEVLERLSGDSIIVQPLGAIALHGPHLPLNTDALIANAVATAAVDAVGDEVDAWLLPPLAYTTSNEHAWSPGTIWLSASTMMSVLDDLGRSIAATAARRLVFMNGHGGNSALLDVANRQIRLNHGLMTFLAHPSLPPDRDDASPGNELGMGIHGGDEETSLMLYVADNLVDMSVAERQVPEWLSANEHVTFGGSVTFGWLSDDFGSSGVIGDPTEATAERGAALFDGAVDAFAAALREIATFELPREEPSR